MKNKLLVTFTAGFTVILLGNITPKLELLPPARAGFFREATKLIIGVQGRTGGRFRVPVGKPLMFVCEHPAGAGPYGAGRAYYNVFQNNRKIGEIAKEFGSQIQIEPVKGINIITVVDHTGMLIDKVELIGESQL